MVRSHIGNVVCRKALCVRVASSPPNKRPPSFGGLFRLPHKNRLSFLTSGFSFIRDILMFRLWQAIHEIPFAIVR